jgi:hypothetical protein
MYIETDQSGGQEVFSMYWNYFKHMTEVIGHTRTCIIQQASSNAIHVNVYAHYVTTHLLMLFKQT